MFLDTSIGINCGAFIWCSTFAAPNKGITIYTNFLKPISLVLNFSISEVEF